MTMKPTASLTVALLGFLSPLSSAKPLKVFILAGQSNMEGHAAISTFDYIGKDPLQPPSPRRCAIPMELHGYVTRSECPI